MNISGGVTNPTGANPLISWSCGAYENETFSFAKVQIRAMGNMCLAATNARTGSGVTLRLCGATPNRERWKVFNQSLSSSGAPTDSSTSFQLAGFNLCMTHSGASLGSAITLKPCDKTNLAQRFDIRAGVIFAKTTPSYCFNVLGGSDAEGQALGLWNACSVDQPNSFFYLSGQLKAMAGQCVESLDDDSYDGKNLVTYPCGDNRRGQYWDYYWE
jgi:hypothetical protein